MEITFEQQLVLGQKWEFYKEQIQSGKEPNPSIYELLSEITPVKRQKKHFGITKYARNISYDYTEEEGITQHKIDAVNQLHNQGRELKKIAEIIGISPLTVVYILTEKPKLKR